jgi:hypothetical protein
VVNSRHGSGGMFCGKRITYGVIATEISHRTGSPMVKKKIKNNSYKVLYIN